MNICKDHRSYDGLERGVSKKDYRLAEEIARDYDKSRDEFYASGAQRIEQAADRAKSKLIDLMGGDNYERYNRFMYEKRIRLADIIDPPQKREISERQLKRMKTDMVKKFFRSRRISMNQVSRILGTYRSYVKRVLSEGEKVSGTLTPLSRVPKEIREFRTNPWTVKRPPYSGWQKAYNWYSNGIKVYFDQYTVPNAGFVGDRLELDVSCADDWDEARLTCDTQNSVWFRPSRAGLVEAYIQLTSSKAERYFWYRNEWGNSYHSSSQWHFIMFHVLHPNVKEPSFKVATSKGIPGVPWSSKTIKEEPFTQGKSYTVHMISHAPVEANKWIRVRFGIRSFLSTVTDDTSVESISSYHWFINSVQIRIRP